MRVAILTVSDRSAAGERPDASGPALAAAAASRGWQVSLDGLVPDAFDAIRNTLLDWCARGDIDIILTTGGTGFAPRDITPEATRAVLEREAPGLAEAMRAASLKVTPHAMLSRSVAGICRQTLIVNLPGSPKAAIENLEAVVAVFPHAVQLLRNDLAGEAGHQA
ncbi:MAG: MogA/MoaB family molybdenum cofactor biosynthesis protein [Chloroflexota bacterium]